MLLQLFIESPIWNFCYLYSIYCYISAYNINYSIQYFPMSDKNVFYSYYFTFESILKAGDSVVHLYFFYDYRFVSERGSSRMLLHVEHIDRVYKILPPQGHKTEPERAADVISLPATPKLRLDHKKNPSFICIKQNVHHSLHFGWLWSFGGQTSH